MKKIIKKGNKIHFNIPLKIQKEECPFDFEAIFSPCKNLFQLTDSSGVIHFIHDVNLEHEAYILEVTDQGIQIASSSASGSLYGLYTLYQLLNQDDIYEMEIEDFPDLKIRGIMIDISRNKIPTMDQMMEMISEFSFMKINHLQFYVEGFSFYIKSLPAGEYLTPMTIEEFCYLQDYAAKLGIDLVPNMNGLGHMTDWLSLEEYKHLAEKEDGFIAWGHHFKASTLNPLDPSSLKLVKTMYRELLSQSQSEYFNMNLDEPFELGQGKSKEECDRTSKVKVYLDYVTKLSDFVKKYDKEPMMWGDVVVNHPEAFQSIPKNVILCDWGYDFDYPFKDHGLALHRNQVPFLLAPGTSSWNSFASRNKDMKETTFQACIAAKQSDGLGVMTTDWGDFGHLQYYPFSLRGFLYCAALSWGENLSDDEINDWLDVYLMKEQGLASTLHHLSTYSELENQYVYNSTLTFQTVMFTDPDLKTPIKLRSDFLKNQILARPMTDKAIQDILNLCEQEKKFLNQKNGLIPEEILNCIRMIEFSVRFQHKMIHQIKLDDQEMYAINHIISKHQILWLQRNRRGGLEQSLSRLISLKEIIEFLLIQV